MTARPLPIGRWLCLIAALLFIADSAVAQTLEITLPTDGYFHPGKYIPITIHPGSAGGVFRSSAPGAISTTVSIQASGAMTTIPFLIVRDQATHLLAELDGRALAIDLTLRPLLEHQRLVGSTAGKIPEDLFPAEEIITLQPDSPQLFRGEPIAWQAFDGVVIGSADYARLPTGTVDDLVKNGTRLIVRADLAPDARRNWSRIGEDWVIGSNPVGPSRSAIEPAAYFPTNGWNPGWPSSVRIRIVATALELSVIFILLSLVRRRFWRWILPGVMVLSLIGVWMWRNRTPAVFRASGAVVIGEDHGWQIDRWLFQTAPGTASEALAWNRPTWPMFDSPNQMDGMKMELRCAADGSALALVYTLNDEGRAAFLARSFDRSNPESAVPETVGRPTRIALLAPRLYGIGIGQWRSIHGEPLTVESDDWGMILLKPPHPLAATRP